MAAAFAERQYGRVARRQLIRAGVSVAEVEHLVAIGVLIPVHHGVYAVGHVSRSKWATWMAAVLACGPACLLSHSSAAGLHGLDDRPAGQPHVTVPHATGNARRRNHRGIEVHRTRADLGELTVVRDGIPATGVERTLLDVAATSGPSCVRRMFHAAEAAGNVDLRRLELLCAEAGRRRGTRLLRALIAAHRPMPFTRSELERAFLRMCDREGIPRPAVNVPVAGFEVDFAWIAQRVVVEVDGWEFHRDRAAFERDRRRDAALQLAGFRVLRATHMRLRDEPGHVAAEVRGLLAPSPLRGPSRD